MSRPYLSIVFTGRNDNHGGDFTKRMRLSLLEFVRLCNNYLIDSEIILVEWNPPPERPPLLEEIKDICLDSSVPIRIVTVPESVHLTYEYSDRLPMFQMIAKNVGIRRASGKFVLVTNLDIIPSKSLMAFLGKKKLAKNVIYRTIRKDVSTDIFKLEEADEVARFCEKNVVRINSYHGSKNVETGEYTACYPSNIDTIADKLGIFPVFGNACGDFQMMDTESWFRLRSYPELEMFSLHIDSLLQYMAVSSGVIERELTDNKVVYHIEHEGGWRPEGEDRKSIIDNLMTRKLRTLTFDECSILNMWMKKNKREFQFNSTAWGHKGKTYVETLISRDGICQVSLNEQGEVEKTVAKKRWFFYRLICWFYCSRMATLRVYAKARVLLAKISPQVVSFYRLTSNSGAIVIFGAGPSGESACKKLAARGQNVAFFIDNDINKHDDKLLERPIYPVKNVVSCSGVEAIVIASLGWKWEMYKQLKKSGFCGNIVFYD